VLTQEVCVPRCCTASQVWQSLFSVRSLVVPMHEDVDAWLKFAGLCRKSGRQRQVRDGGGGCSWSGIQPSLQAGAGVVSCRCR
jgi:hypothetical protein